jgi:hypothetical protein
MNPQQQLPRPFLNILGISRTIHGLKCSHPGILAATSQTIYEHSVNVLDHSYNDMFLPQTIYNSSATTSQTISEH